MGLSNGRDDRDSAEIQVSSLDLCSKAEYILEGKLNFCLQILNYKALHPRLI